MAVQLDSLLAQVDADHLRDLTLDMVRIPSPTGDSVAVTEYYVEAVRALGLPVEVVRDYPDSPSTIARLGDREGVPTLTMDGHLDTIHASHPEPYVEGGRIYGRGSGDMKSGVAAFIEATRILVENDVPLGGNLILATHSLHEAPVGHMEGLQALIARGDVFVDAAMVAESAFDKVNTQGKGQSLFFIEITREGEVLHENVARPQGVPNPLDHAVGLCQAFLERDQALAEFDHDVLGPETFFIGQIHGGDFYNRVPTRAFVNGIYRFWADKSWEDVDRTFHEIIDSVPHHPDLHIELKSGGNGLGYAVDPEAGIVRSLRSSYQRIVGRELPLGGSLSVCDANVIAREANIPVVTHGTGSTTAHANLEWVEIDNIVRTTKVFITTILDYLGVRRT